MNVVILMGRLVAEPELKTLDSGSTMLNFKIAVDRFSKDKKKTADFISCQAWGKNADFIAQYFHKGNPIAITGRIQTRSYEKDGKNVWVTEVVVEQADFVPSSSNRTSSEQNDTNGDLLF